MSSINTSYGNYQSKSVGSSAKYEKTSKSDKAEVSSKNTAEKTEKRTDSFERTESSNTAAVGYSKKAALGIKNEGMKDTIAALLGNQASKASGSNGISIESVLRSYGVEPIKSDGSDDFWGAEKTANRILDFAKSLAGNDKEAFQKVKNAFTKAFGECEKIWGGRLPDISYETKSRVEAGFDEWEKELSETSAAEE